MTSTSFNSCSYSASYSTRYQKPLKSILFCGITYMEIGNQLARSGRLELGHHHITGINNGQIQIHLEMPVRGRYVYVLYGAYGDLYKNITEMGSIMKTCKQEGALRTVAIVPYLPHPLKMIGNQQTAYSIVSSLFSDYHADQVMTLGLPEVQHAIYSDMPMKNIDCDAVFVDWIKAHVSNYTSSIVVSQAIEDAKRTTAMADKLDCDFTVTSVIKRKNEPVPLVDIIGTFINSHAILLLESAEYSDLLHQIINVILSKGAKSVYVIATHGVFSADAYIRIMNSSVVNMVVTNTIPQFPSFCDSKMLKVDTSYALLNAILCDEHQQYFG